MRERFLDFILFVKELFLEIFSFGEYDYFGTVWKEFIFSYIFIWIMIIIIVSIIVFLIVELLSQRIEISKIRKINEKIVFSIVTKKIYDEPSSNLIFINKVPISHQNPARYNVYIKYEDVEDIIDSRELFNQVNVGDQISTCLKTGFDKKGKIVKQWIELAPLN